MSNYRQVSRHRNVLCIIGYPIEHSMSPIMHNAAIEEQKLNYIYLPFKISPAHLSLAVKGFKIFNIKGINITLPFKQKIMNYLDEIDPIAKKIGAVNTIKNEDGYLRARNTDAEAARKALLDGGFKFSGKDVIILGAGGAARAVSYVLAEDIDKMIIINRTEKKAIKLAKELKNYYGIKVEGKLNSFKVLEVESKRADILINTTPVGMYPNVEDSPFPPDFLHKDLSVYDIIYNPLETKLIKAANKIGCKTLGGLDMLVNQGALAFEWWINKKPNIDLMKNKIIKFLRNQ